jgi:hypothetical protein
MITWRREGAAVRTGFCSSSSRLRLSESWPRSPAAQSHVGGGQRWASTLANRSNARHRSNIRAPHAPPPRFMYTKCGNLCGQRGRKRFIASWGLRMSHICPCTPCPSPQGYRSKVESPHFTHHVVGVTYVYRRHRRR